jgi:long-chain fatty acid transport protein
MFELNFWFRRRLMMVVRFLRSPVASAVAGLVFALGAAPVFAGGFQLNESSASGLGNAFAGGAAVAEDASTLWSNVAGMARLRGMQAVGALHLVTPSTHFRDGGSLAAANQPLGGNGGDAGGVNPVPNFYIVGPIDNAISVGLGVTAPWGLVTEYESGWAGRFQAIKSSIKTINVNPGVSWKVGNGVSLGLGLSYQHISAEFTNQVNYSGALLSAAEKGGIAPGPIAAATPGLESGARITGSDDSWGWNTGVLWQFDDRNRAGIHYRSRVSYKIGGDAAFSNPTLSAPPTVAALSAAVNTRVLYGSPVTADVELPAIFNLSYFSKIDDRWDIMVDAQWTQWSTIKDLTFVRSNGTVLQSTPQNFQDVWKIAMGGNYRYNDTWTWRGGVAYDQSPVQTAYRTPRLPDADKTWLSAGFQYTANPKLKWDFGAAYLFVNKADINTNGHPPSTPTYGLLKGRYNADTLILSAQVNYTF